MKEFDSFMNKYNYQSRLSEKDEIDLIIKLGVLKFKPNWLNQQAIKSIDKYYPGVQRKKTDYKIEKNMFALSCAAEKISDYDSCGFKVAVIAVDDLVIFYGLSELTIGVLTLNGLSKSGVVKWLNQEGRKLVQNAESQLCSKAGRACSVADTPSVPPAVQSGSSDKLNYGDCGVTVQKIYSVLSEVKARYSEILQDKYKLPASGPMSIAGHQQQFRNKQAQLRNLLGAAEAAGCKVYPSDAWTWATIETPSPR